MKIKIYLILLACLNVTLSFGQTNPTPQTIPFNFNTQTGGVLPAGMALHRFGTTAGTIPITRTTAPGNADLPYIVGANSGGWNDQGANGIGILASGSNAAGALIVSINTVGKSSITVSWKVITILNQASRDNSIALQYRVGTTGNYIDIGSTSTYSSTGTANGANQSYSEVLPAGAENQSEVQLRWIYWESVSTSGSRDRLAITDISVTPPAVACVAPSAQPTAIVFGTITDVSIAGSFTAPSPPADEYLIVMSTNNALTSNPINGQIYNVGDDVGDGVVIGKGSSLNFSAFSLTSSTNYYFFVFSLNSACTGGPLYLSTNPLMSNATTSAGLPPCVAPGSQPSSLTFSNVTVNSIHGTFNGTTADEYLVLKSTSSTLSNNPVNGTVYNPGDILGNASVIQRNNSTTFTATSLLPNTQYYFFIFSSNALSCINGPVYNTTAPLQNSQTTLPLPACTTPSSQATALSLNPSNNAISGNFTAATGADSYLVIRSTSSTLSIQPSDNIDYAIGDNIGGGVVVALSAATSFVASTLTPSTTYYIFIYSANKNCTGGTKYLTTAPLNGNTTTTSAPLNSVYFGTLHSHSDYSDGNKDIPGYTPADDYTYAMTSQCLDYLGISEHNHFSSTNNPGNIVTNYHQGSIQANTFTATHSNFVALYGMEWGVISGGGHVVVYGDGMDLLFGWESNVGGVVGNNYDVFVAKNDYIGASGLFKTINDNISTKTFATLAHPNTADFGNIAGTYNLIADDAIVGTAVESGPAFSTSTTYNDPASSLSYLSYFQKLLAKGYHVGPTIDHDNHNTTFGRTTYSRTAIIAPSLTRTEIVKAMRNMHFYVTQDCDTKVDFTINTNMMGSIVTDRNAPVISISLSDATTDIASSNIKIMYGMPGSGVLPAVIYSTTGTSATFTDNNLSDMATGYYYVDITNGSRRIITSPIWYTRNDGIVLPVTLSSFDVQKVHGSVKISWITEQESNSSYFTVQHSTKGSIWTDVGRVNAAGFSNSPIVYDLIDNAPTIGNNYYRLKQVDKDGRTTYSSIKFVVFDAGYAVLITPNPAHDYINVYLTKNNSNPSRISLFGINGSLVKEYITNQLTLKIDIAGLSKGIYFIKVLNGDIVRTQKIVVQ